MFDNSGTALKQATVLVHEDDLDIMTAVAAHEGRPVSDYIREAFHLAALRAQHWAEEDWEMPELSIGCPLDRDELRQLVRDGIIAKCQRTRDAGGPAEDAAEMG